MGIPGAFLYRGLKGLQEGQPVIGVRVLASNSLTELVCHSDDILPAPAPPSRVDLRSHGGEEEDMLFPSSK